MPSGGVSAKPIAVAFRTGGSEGAGPDRAAAVSAADRHELGTALFASLPFLVLTASPQPASRSWENAGVPPGEHGGLDSTFRSRSELAPARLCRFPVPALSHS